MTLPLPSAIDEDIMEASINAYINAINKKIDMNNISQKDIKIWNKRILTTSY